MLCSCSVSPQLKTPCTCRCFLLLALMTTRLARLDARRTTEVEKKKAGGLAARMQAASQPEVIEEGPSEVEKTCQSLKGIFAKSKRATNVPTVFNPNASASAGAGRSTSHSREPTPEAEWRHAKDGIRDAARRGVMVRVRFRSELRPDAPPKGPFVVARGGPSPAREQRGGARRSHIRVSVWQEGKTRARACQKVLWSHDQASIPCLLLLNAASLVLYVGILCDRGAFRMWFSSSLSACTSLHTPAPGRPWSVWQCVFCSVPCDLKLSLHQGSVKDLVELARRKARRPPARAWRFCFSFPKAIAAGSPSRKRMYNT